MKKLDSNQSDAESSYSKNAVQSYLSGTESDLMFSRHVRLKMQLHGFAFKQFSRAHFAKPEVFYDMHLKEVNLSPVFYAAKKTNSVFYRLTVLFSRSNQVTAPDNAAEMALALSSGASLEEGE